MLSGLLALLSVLPGLALRTLRDQPHCCAKDLIWSIADIASRHSQVRLTSNTDNNVLRPASLAPGRLAWKSQAV